MQLYSGISLAETASEKSAYQQALKTGGYHDDLEIQTAISVISRIRKSAAPQVIYDIGARDGAHSLALDKHLNQKERPTHIYAYEEDPELAKTLRQNCEELKHVTAYDWTDLGKYNNCVIDYIRINDHAPMFLIRKLHVQICHSLPVVLVQTSADKIADVVDQMLDFGYNYYVVLEHADPFKRTFIHQLERMAIYETNQSVREQKNITMLFVVPGGHPSLRCTRMLPWDQFLQELPVTL